LSRARLEFKTTEVYDKSFAALPSDTQKRALGKLALYEDDPRYPSLRVKKLEGVEGIWELSVTTNYRITFQRKGTMVLLRNIGTHDILKREW
jgi:mRNA-degrading endonuclease YafQ of YafQ-DinJ toxin-antitoxin module